MPDWQHERPILCSMWSRLRVIDQYFPGFHDVYAKRLDAMKLIIKFIRSTVVAEAWSCEACT